MNAAIMFWFATSIVPTLAIVETSIRIDFAARILAIQEEAAEEAVAIDGDSTTTSPTATGVGPVPPFVNANLPDGWYLTTSPVFTANWEADADNRWTVPLGGGFGRVMRIGSPPVNIQLQGFYNVEKPAGVGEWSIRFQVQLLFPTG